MNPFRKRSATDLAGRSLDRLARRRFLRNPLSIVSLAVIGFFALVAILGYLITPDHTPYCNQQYLELSTLKPFSKASFLITDSTRTHTSPLRRMTHGEPLPYTATPIKEYRYARDSIIATPYNGDPIVVAASEASVDERTYEEDQGEPFILAEYVRKNDIDIVVYDGDILAFSGDAFL